MSYFLNIDRFGNEIVNETLDFNPIPVPFTPTPSGNTTNKNSFVIDPNGDMYFIDKDGESFKINTSNPLDVLTGIQPTPNATGNTTNLNSVFKDANGDTWIVDYKGDAIKAASAPVPETVTNITNTVSGHKIGTYTNESGVAVDINETITSVSELSILGNVITLKYVDENGTTNTKSVTIPSDVVTTITNTVSGHAIGTYTNENGVQVTINETITSIGTISYNSSTGVLTIPYTDEAGVVNDKTVTLPTPLNVLTTVQPTPTATGNTTNLNSSFKDASGNTWIVDSNGDAILCSSSPFKNLNEFHVDPNGSDVTGDGSQEKPFQTIAKAVSLAVAGDQVIVHAGVYNENITLSNPNVALVGAQSEYGALTQINGNVTVTAAGTSVKIADITINGVSHTGTAPLYLDHVTVNTTLVSSSSAYLEIKNTSVQQGDITKSAGTGLIENSKIDNVNITGANTAVTIRDSYQDANSTISYGAGTIYGVLNVQGGEISINASAIALETAALAQGLSAEMAKEFETSDFMKLGMLRPDLEDAPTKIVTWDEVTGRLEVSNASSLKGDTYKTNSSTCQDIVSTGNITLTVATGLAYTPLQDIIVYADNGNHMHGEVVSYDAATGVLVMHVRRKTGSGNYCSWVVNLDGINVSELSVTFGTSAPTSAGIEGDEYFITSNGTSTGTITAQYIYDATSSSWILRPSGGSSANWVDAVVDPSATGNTGTLPRFVSNTVNGSKWYIDANGVAKLIEGTADNCGVVYFNTTDPSTATIFDTENPPATNNDALKNLDCALYIGTDGSVWTSNGTSYSTKVYSFPLHQRDLILATTSQTSFTILKVPVGSTELVHVTRNGVDISNAWTWVAKVGTYIPASNGGKTMDAGDIIRFHYEAY